MRFKPNIVWNPLCVPEYVDSYSPSWKKPREFVRHISDKADRDGVDFHESTSARALLKRVHHPKYVDQVLSGQQPNGFGTTDPKVAESCTYTCGAMVEGVMMAREGYTSCVPVSGFHHAGYDSGGGFCTFNGLALAAIVADEFGMKPGIADFDAHYGDGTVSVFSELGIENIPHYTFGGTSFASRMDKAGDRMIRLLPGIMENVFKDCGVLLYQAGADPHIDDPLGGYLTTEQMKARDDIVFKFAKDKKIPVVWNLAGGYQKDLKKVLALHEQTYNSWLTYA